MIHKWWFSLPVLVMLPASPVLAQQRDGIELGAAVLAMPSHQGADKVRILPLPLIEATSGPFFISTAEGAGVQISHGPITLGGSATYVIGYRRKDVRDGAGRVSNALGARLFAKAAVGPAIVGVSMTKTVAGGTGGVVGEASMTYPIMVSSRLAIAPRIGIGWMDRRHNDRYFNSQALSSRQARTGFSDLGATLSGRYQFNDRIALTASLGAVRLLPVAADGPIVVRRTTAHGMLGLSYKL